MVTVGVGGGPGGAGGVARVGGDDGADGEDPHPEHAAAVTIRKRKRRNTAILAAGGASGLDLRYHKVQSAKFRVQKGVALHSAFCTLNFGEV